MTCHQAVESLCMSVLPADEAGRGYGSPSVSYCLFKDTHFLPELVRRVGIIMLTCYRTGLAEMFT